MKEPEAPPPKVGWDAITKPKEHSTIDYSRWGNLGDDLSDDEDEDEDEPQYAYRLKRVGLSTFKSLGT
jgi:import receptor subunit TOM34